MRDDEKKLWNNIRYTLKEQKLFTKALFIKYLNIFWLNIMNNIHEDDHIFILLRLEFNKINQFVTIGDLKK
jgi:hypothetical protein